MNCQGFIKIIHHRNQLKHYRSTMKEFRALFDTVSLDLDFSENLQVPVKYEPQSLHWANAKIVAHISLEPEGSQKNRDQETQYQIVL